MNFRTEIFPSKSNNLIHPSDSLLLIGSCFAANIGEYFVNSKFNCLVNPFGVLYNPASVLSSLKIITENKCFVEKDLFHDQGEWHSFYHHSDFSNHNKEQCLDNINNRIEEANKFIKSVDKIFITYGTSYVYELLETKSIVSNCHKIPANKFNRRRLELNEVKNTISETITLLKGVNPEIDITFTVSPVRHWKDGAHDNQLSKSILLLAIEEITKKIKHTNYFPSYEIVMDDLRDYRFFSEDLLHPNKIATDYIWEKLVNSSFSEEAQIYLNKIIKLNNAFNHRVRNKQSDKHKQFVLDQLNKIEQLQKEYLHLNLEKEKKYFLEQKD